MNRFQMESFFLKHERKKTYYDSNFKKLSHIERRLILKYFNKLASFSSKIDIRYINLGLKFEKNFKKRFFQTIKLRNLYDKNSLFNSKTNPNYHTVIFTWQR